MRLSGLHVVTGGGSGIGRGVAHALRGAGATVAILDSDARAATSVANEVGGRSHVVDVGDAGEVDRAFGALGPIQGLVTCAAVVDVQPIVSLEAASWSRVLNVQLDGTFFCLRAAARTMLDHGTSGTVVAITSVNARFGQRGLSAYGAAKAGTEMLIRTAALELAQSGIRVNAVAPGIVETEMTAAALADPRFRHEAASHIPFGRIARPDDIADVVMFLASTRSRWLTGQVLAADGGVALRVEPKIAADEEWTRAALRARFSSPSGAVENPATEDS
ncbi:SDR family oxidoreductase [Amycolatopsis sp. NPDC049253]|uniref:SDR family NAD(P)-dependent oxidoreductase n=1 Tax=Amycolatopsis sp. NPDC049253 TaxID=3155274 RepID=UPI003439379A